MDNLFLIRTLTTAVNAMKSPSRVIYNRIFAQREHLEPSDRLAFEIITGSEGVLGNIAVSAPASVDTKTGRTVVTVTAPRISNKRFIHTSELNALRAYGQQIATEMMMSRIAREQRDMRNKHDRTLEFWAANALKGKIYDKDLSTVLVDYGVSASHLITLTGDDLWSSPNASPVTRLRAWKKTIEDDSGAAITGWVAFMGSEVMDALLTSGEVLDLMKYDRGSQLAETGRIQRLVEIEMHEYNGSFLDDDGVRRRFVGADEIILVGLCDDLVDVPYAPIVDDDAPGGVGNVGADGQGVMFFSKSWKEEDPSGRWIKCESRPLPVLQRPGAVITATVV